MKTDKHSPSYLFQLLLNENFFRQSFRENQNIRFIFSNFFAKIVPFLRKYGKTLHSQPGHR